MRLDVKLLYEVMVATIGYITTSIDVRCEFAVPFDPRTDHALRAFLIKFDFIPIFPFIINIIIIHSLFHFVN